MSLLQSRCLKRSFFVEELYETWKLEHDRAMLACDIEEIGAECLELCNLLLRAWKARDKEFFSDGAGVLERETVMLDTATDKVAGVIDRLIIAAESATAKGFAIDAIEPLRTGVAAVRLSQANSPRFDANCPEIREMIEQSRADYARGDYRYLDELIHEV